MSDHLNDDEVDRRFAEQAWGEIAAEGREITRGLSDALGRASQIFEQAIDQALQELDRQERDRGRGPAAGGVSDDY